MRIHFIKAPIKDLNTYGHAMLLGCQFLHVQESVFTLFILSYPETF